MKSYHYINFKDPFHPLMHCWRWMERTEILCVVMSTPTLQSSIILFLLSFRFAYHHNTANVCVKQAHKIKCSLNNSSYWKHGIALLFVSNYNDSPGILTRCKCGEVIYNGGHGATKMFCHCTWDPQVHWFFTRPSGCSDSTRSYVVLPRSRQLWLRHCPPETAAAIVRNF